MRVLVLIRANADSEAGVLPDAAFVGEMGRYNEELVKAGVMLSAEGLYPSSKAKRVHFTHGRPATVVDGPFAETKELIAGYWLWQVHSLDEAVEWVKRCPSPKGATEGEIEIRQVFEIADLEAAQEIEAGKQEPKSRAGMN